MPGFSVTFVAKISRGRTVSNSTRSTNTWRSVVICKKSSDLMLETRVFNFSLLQEHQKPFVCPMPSCGRGFAEKIKLKQHQMSMHIKSRPYKCRVEGCTADFNEMANRNSHERTVHKYDYKKKVETINKSAML